MTREEAKQYLPILQAYSEGKEIEYHFISGWDKAEEIFLDKSPSSYRIKPRSKYRPFESVGECWKEMQKHQPLGWLRESESECSDYNLSTYVDDTGVVIGAGSVERAYILFPDAFKQFKFMDGAPFGVNVDEDL